MDDSTPLLGPPPKYKSSFCGVKGFSPDVLHPRILILTHYPDRNHPNILFNFAARYVKSDVLTPPIFFRFRVAQPGRKPLEK